MGGGANPPERAPTYEFARFSQKLHEIKKILGRSRGGGTNIRICQIFPKKLHEIKKILGRSKGCAPGATPPSLRFATAGKQSEAKGESAGAHTLCSQPSRDTI